jgi:hypothetical protein
VEKALGELMVSCIAYEHLQAAVPLSGLGRVYRSAEKRRPRASLTGRPARGVEKAMGRADDVMHCL